MNFAGTLSTRLNMTHEVDIFPGCIHAVLFSIRDSIRDGKVLPTSKIDFTGVTQSYR